MARRFAAAPTWLFLSAFSRAFTSWLQSTRGVQGRFSAQQHMWQCTLPVAVPAGDAGG